MMEGEEASGTTPLTSTVTTAPASLFVHRTVPVFDTTQEEWIEYTERLENYFLANDITDAAKKKAILLNAVGPST